MQVKADGVWDHHGSSGGLRNYQLRVVFWIVRTVKTRKGTRLWLKGWKEQLKEFQNWADMQCLQEMPSTLSLFASGQNLEIKGRWDPWISFRGFWNRRFYLGNYKPHGKVLSSAWCQDGREAPVGWRAWEDGQEDHFSDSYTHCMVSNQKFPITLTRKQR